MIVLWRITGQCNLACAFCAYDRRRPVARGEADLTEVERVARLLGAYRRATGERVLLSWLGGEPLLWPPLLALSRRLREEQGLQLSLTTNGTGLHRAAVRDGILAGLAEITVSVDGLADVHDRLRSQRGLWQRLRAGVTALDGERRRRGSALKLRANIVLMRDTLPGFGALCEELARWGVDEITFNPLGGRDRPEFFPDHGLRPSDVRSLRSQLPGLRATLAARGVALCGGDSYLDRIEASAWQRPLRIDDCRPGEEFLFIDETGRIAPCSFTVGDYGANLADIRTLDDLRALPARYRAARARTPAPACGDCPSTQVFAKFTSHEFASQEFAS